VRLISFRLNSNSDEVISASNQIVKDLYQPSITPRKAQRRLAGLETCVTCSRQRERGARTLYILVFTSLDRSFEISFLERTTRKAVNHHEQKRH